MYRCQYCDVHLNSEEQLNQHRAGKNHAKKLTKLGLPVPQVEKQELPTEAFIPKYGGAFVAAQSTEQIGETKGESTKQTEKNEPKQVVKSETNTLTEESVTVPTPPTKASKGMKRKFSEIYCDVCHVTINSDIQAQQHFLGQKHTKKLQLISAVSDGEATSTTDPSGCKKMKGHFCHFCNITVNSESQMQVHREGSKHRKNVEKQQTLSGVPGSSNTNSFSRIQTCVSTS